MSRTKGQGIIKGIILEGATSNTVVKFDPMRIGENCYVDYCIGKIVGQTGGAWVVDLSKILDWELTKHPTLVNNKCYLFAKGEVEPPITSIFNVGDRIQTAFPGNRGFRGVIQCFDLKENKAVCKSNSIEHYDNKRTRYAYGPYEIVQQPDTFTFQLNKCYPYATGPLRAVEHPTEADAFLLVEDLTGHVLISVSQKCTYDFLIRYGLTSVTLERSPHNVE